MYDCARYYFMYTTKTFNMKRSYEDVDNNVNTIKALRKPKKWHMEKTLLPIVGIDLNMSNIDYYLNQIGQHSIERKEKNKKIVTLEFMTQINEIVKNISLVTQWFYTKFGIKPSFNLISAIVQSGFDTDYAEYVSTESKNIFFLSKTISTLNEDIELDTLCRWTFEFDLGNSIKIKCIEKNYDKLLFEQQINCHI